MIKRIIVAYDGSELAREGFAYASMLAAPARVGIVGLHVIEPPPPPIVVADAAIGFDPNPALVEVAVDSQRERAEERARFERELDEFAEHCDRRSIAYEKRITEGPLLDSLRELVDPTDLIVVGMKGRFARAGLGSTTKALVQLSPCPVMIVSGPLRPMNRLLGVYDGSGASKRAVGWAMGAAEQTGWPLTVLAVSSAKLPLDDALEQAQGLAPEAQVIHYGPDGDDATAQIKAAADHASFALLALGAYTDSWLHQLLFGGTTGQVLSQVEAPVVLVH